MNNRSFYRRRLAWLGALFLMGAATARSQEATAPPPAPAPVPDAAEAARAEAAAQSATLAKQLRALSFDRSADALFEATRTRKEGGGSPAEAFQMAVLLGDWDSVAKTLAGLAPQDGMAVYTSLLGKIAKQAIPVGETLKAPENETPNEDADPFGDPSERLRQAMEANKKQRSKPAPLLSEDLYALIDAAPGNLGENDIKSISKLVGVALGEGGRATFVARLAKGWKGIGGDTAQGRALAAALLSSLGWIKDAAPFLPLKEDQWKDADTLQLIYAMEYFTRVGIDERDERMLQQAAALCTYLMKHSRFGNYTRPQFKMALDRLVQLLPALEPEQAKKLIRDELFKQSATLSDLISQIAEIGQNAAKTTDLQARAASLGTQHLILESLSPLPGPLPSNAAVLVMNWLAEAEACYRTGGLVAQEMSQSDRIMLRRYGMGGRQAKVNNLSAASILETAPPKDIIARLNPGLAQRVKLTVLKVSVLQDEKIDTTLLGNYVKAHPGLEKEVCQDVLAGWVSKRTKPAESEQVRQMRAYGYYIPPQLLQMGAGIPLTRLRQNQNIENFKNLLGELRRISPGPIDPGLVVQAFMTLHSGAEVYRLDDIISIFGPPEKMAREELLTLLDGMRQRLGEQWRDPKTQQAAATNRTEEEAKDEVSRGYRTALELAKRAIPDNDPDWKSLVVRGQLFYDASQYEFDRKVTLKDYVNLRDQAFSSFSKAAAAYAAKLPSMPRGQWTIEPYQAWFFVMLGASDLAQLTSNAARADPGLKGIGDAMRALPGDAAAGHLALFGKMLGDLFPRVPPTVRQRFLAAGLKITGEDNPAAKSAAGSLAYYTGLLDELQLHLAVDGPARVGHTQPFGVFIGIDATRQLMRESGGFGKYIQSPANNQMMMNQGEPAQRNMREEFTKNIHAALDENFEVVSLTFADDASKPVNLEREGWVATPLVYAILRAKTATVDRIPSIQLDMDFVDQPGTVVLPVMSNVVTLDARDASVPPRPCPNLAMTVNLDQRDWKDGKIAVDIQARGNGVIPKLDELFDCQRPGFDLDVVDSGLSVAGFSSDGKARVPAAERSWQLAYRKKPGLKGDIRFPFPKPLDAATPVKYQRYEDADLVTVEPAAAAAGITLESPGDSARGFIALAAGLAACIVLAVWLARRRKSRGGAATDDLTPPADPTPFNTVAYLRRVAAGPLESSERDSLNLEIAAIGDAYFSSGAPPEMDLAGIARKWHGVVSRRSR